MPPSSQSPTSTPADQRRQCAYQQYQQQQQQQHASTVPAAPPSSPPPLVPLKPSSLSSLSTLSSSSSSSSSSPSPSSPSAPQQQKPSSPSSFDISFPLSISDISLDPHPSLVHIPSPSDWRDELIYSIVIDRFSRGTSTCSSKKIHTSGDPSLSNTFHGGNLLGVLNKLDYLQNLGVTAIWLSPVYENPSGATYYHGYAPVNFLSVDPRKGTLDEYRTIVNEAHARGIRVLFDWVCNHTCHAFDYEHDDTYFRELNNGPPKNISRWTRQLIPDDLMNKDNFYRRGDIFDWNNEDHRIKGDFFTYEHGQSYCALDLSRRKTQEIMIHIALFWMANTGIDGFRCDAVIHVDPCFWRRFNFAVRKFARERMGKNNFLLLGEAFATDADVLAGFLSPYWGGFDSVFDFEDYFCAVGLFRGERHANRLKLAHDASRTVLKTATETLHLSSSSSSNNSSDENEVVPPKFFTKVIDSHDVERYLRSNDSIRRLDVGLTYLLTTSGMPILLYGTEQGLRNGALSKQLEQFNLDLSRVDMFPEGQFKSAGGVHPVNAFCSDSRGYKLVRRLARVRARFVALRRGELWSRRADDCGTYVFSRLFMNGEEEEEVVVAINPGEAEVRLIDVHVHHRGMEERVLVDVLEQEEIKEQKDDESVCYRTTTRSGTNGGTVVDIVVPAMSGRILVDACKLDM